MKTFSMAAAGLLALGACAAPAVTAFNADSVTIEARSASNNARITAQAEETCAAVGRTAQYASSRRVPGPADERPVHTHLFLCLG